MPAEVTLDLPTLTNANVCLLCCRRSRSRSNHSFQRGPPPSQLRQQQQQQPLVPAVRPQTCHRARVRSPIRAPNGHGQRLPASLGPSEAPGRAGTPVLLSRAPPPGVQSGMRPCAHPRLGAGFTSRGGGGGGGGVTSGKAPALKRIWNGSALSWAGGRRLLFRKAPPGGASRLQTGGIPTVPLNSLTSPPPSPHQDGV